jgi:23S rRNA pseudouridine2605 synthase
MTENSDPPGERIARRLSRAGICSRREAERWIAAGRVTVDGSKISTPATLVTEASSITVDGKKVETPQETGLWLYHKPSGLVCTNSDPEGRPTVFDRLPPSLPRVMLIGRLDLASEGLLLLTNDGALARKLELPATGWIRRYRVRVYGRPDEDALKKLEAGVTVDGVTYGPIRAEIDSAQRSNAWLTISLQEGRNREVRRVMEHLGLRVNRLIRTAYGPFQLGSLPRGEVRAVTGKVLREQVGKAEIEGKRPRQRKIARRRR